VEFAYIAPFIEEGAIYLEVGGIVKEYVTA
jgi:hypothetical protein